MMMIITRVVMIVMSDRVIDIELPDGKVIYSLQEDETCKYLGILEADKFLGEEMKLKKLKGVFEMIKKVLNSKLNERNLEQGVVNGSVNFKIFNNILV